MPAKKDDVVQTVEVAGPGASAQRKNDTAAKIVINAAELLQYGDAQLSSVLKRQPGISVVGNELRMRGLGSGYTQILLNGDAVAPGFSIDSIAPELIERVEILRTTSAEYSAQAVAGSINIILKKGVSSARKVVKFSLAHGENNWNPSLSLEVADKNAGFYYAVTGTLSKTGYENAPVVTESLDGTATQARTLRLIQQKNLADFWRLALTPRLNWELDNGDTLSWQSLIDYYRNVNWGRDHEILLEGDHTLYPDNNYRASSHTGMLRSDLNWAHRINADSKLNAKLGLSYNKRETDYNFYGYPQERVLPFNRHVVSNAIDSSVSSSGKYLSRFRDDHSLALGWDTALTQRSEARLQFDRQPGSSVVQDLNEDYKANVRRLALFVQDEWDVTNRLQAYLGLRWEGLNTETAGRLMPVVQTRSSVWSPVMQLLWKLPEQEKDQLRFALSRTYKAPTPRSLVPRRYTANNDNGPNNPDYQGNPQLLPELAWGADLAYESYFAKNSMFSLSAYAKRVQDVTVQNLYEKDKVWITSPYNHGTARVMGIEFDARFALQNWLLAAPPVEVRVNAARNWSKLDAIPGPDNRLTDQVPLTANLGMDYKPGEQQSFGFNFNFQTGGNVQVATGLRNYSGVSRNLDMYGLWRLENKVQLRLSINNLLHQDVLQASQYKDQDGRRLRSSVTPGSTTIRFQVEKSL
ncbi:TonB-dependent receptor [Undibacterium sp. CY18W]|uniref:TonB-dependent receptor n=1 Tax=Undibacterium hunanense TaxID=2762292 RepID=A0ABR6ZS78_9BURK|nr:TonB-dependent receptor [Undibacterium hunanense]MBC3918712.1 TonB-dependent receptor [Undibacterium hunanense]